MSATNTRRHKMLQLLLAHPEGLTTSALVDLIGEPGNRMSLLSWYGDLLRKMASAGYLTKAGIVPTGRKRSNGSALWKANQYTAQHARMYEQFMQEQDRDKKAARARREAEDNRRAELQRLLDEAALTYGPDSSLRDRRRVAAELYAAGCTQASIAKIFDVSKQMISLDLKGRTSGRRNRSARAYGSDYVRALGKQSEAES